MPPIALAQIPALYKKAMDCQKAGRLQEALNHYSTILSAKPDIVEVHFQVGRIFSTSGDYKKSVTHLKIASQIKPAEPAIWAALAESVLGLDEGQATTEFLKSVRSSPLPRAVKDRLATDVASPKTSSDVGLGSVSLSEMSKLTDLMSVGNFSEAIRMGSGLAKKHPLVAPIVALVATAHQELGQMDLAEAKFKKALDVQKNYAEGHNSYGQFLVLADRLDEAEKQFRLALKTAPNMVLALTNLGQVLTRQSHTEQAEKILSKALRLEPKNKNALINMANLKIKLKNDAQAVKYFHKAIKNGHKTAYAYALLGRSLGSLGEISQAYDAFDRAISLDPTYAKAYAYRASLMQEDAKFDEAEAYFRKAIALEPQVGDNYRVFAASYKMLAEDPLIDDMKAQFCRDGVADTDKMELGFGLAKAMEDTKQYDQVFNYLNEANALMLKRFPFDIQTRFTEIDALKASFERFDPSQENVSGYKGFAPIFITGLPRSGTTLVEQIISSHSRVTGAGELGKFPAAALKFITKDKTSFKSIQDIPAKDFKTLGETYAREVRGLYPDGDIITDKSIQTYTFIGLARLALPNARIIVVRRDPRDNLLSIYKNMFQDGTHLYAYNLKTLALWYKDFLGILKFYQALMPGSFYEISYDNLIANPEDETRKLIDACGLGWQDACLKPQDNKRKVDTLSLYQVRQPIYKSSSKAWQRYEDDLQELLEELKKAGV